MRRREAGLTLVEIMVAVLLVGIAAAFVFAIQVRTSQALRDQSAVSETQLTLRSATDVILRDVRQAGYMVKSVSINTPGLDVPTVMGALDIGNSSTSPDTLTLQYADATVSAHICGKKGGGGKSANTNCDGTGSPSYQSAETQVDSAQGFNDGDILLAVYVRPGDPLYGTGCLLEVTAINKGDVRIQHNPGSTDGWNAPANSQCDNVKDVWRDYPYMVFVRVALRTYRIKPGDPRGVLQVSPSGGIHANDWIDIAVGIVDMQLAMYVYHPNDATDYDGDPTEQDGTHHDWFSSGNMGSILAADPANQVLQLSVTLVAKTTKEVAAVQLDKTPDLYVGDKNYNHVGDRTGTTLPVNDPSSMYYGSHVYRSYTATADLRNIGVGYW